MWRRTFSGFRKPRLKRKLFFDPNATEHRVSGLTLQVGGSRQCTLIMHCWGCGVHKAMLSGQLKWIPGSQIKKCSVGTMWRWQMVSSKVEAMLSDEWLGVGGRCRETSPAKRDDEGVGIRRPRSRREVQATTSVPWAKGNICCHNSRFMNMTLPVLITPYQRQLENPVLSILNPVFYLTNTWWNKRKILYMQLKPWTRIVTLSLTLTN